MPLIKEIIESVKQMIRKPIYGSTLRIWIKIFQVKKIMKTAANYSGHKLRLQSHTTQLCILAP